LANFITLFVDPTTSINSLEEIYLSIRCFEENCERPVSSKITIDDYIHWICLVRGNEGLINE